MLSDVLTAEVQAARKPNYEIALLLGTAIRCTTGAGAPL